MLVNPILSGPVGLSKLHISPYLVCGVNRRKAGLEPRHVVAAVHRREVATATAKQIVIASVLHRSQVAITLGCEEVGVVAKRCALPF